MTSAEGWQWLETTSPSPKDVAAAEDADTELAHAFAICFRGSHGERVLRHLRALTLERALGPESPDTLLRYVEGQRQLVAYICGLVERARHKSAVAGISSRVGEREKEGNQP